MCSSALTVVSQDANGNASTVAVVNAVKEALHALGVDLKADASMAEITYFGIGGTTDLLSLKQHESIPDVVKLLETNGIPFKFLGGGSNLLVVDGELPWVVLQLAPLEPDVVIEGNFALVDASAELGRR